MTFPYIHNPAYAPVFRVLHTAQRESGQLARLFYACFATCSPPITHPCLVAGVALTPPVRRSAARQVA